MENTTRALKPIELPIPLTEAYAMTDLEIWEAIEFLATKLKPVRLEDLDPDDRECAICQTEYCVSEDVKLSHPPVKTTCGHIFGKTCIIRWLDPLCFWGPTEGAASKIQCFRCMANLVEDAKTSCPLCRREFFSQVELREPMELLAVRLWLWDNYYFYAGIARNEKEERSREHLWNFVNYCRSLNEFVLGDSLRYDIFEDVHRLLKEFTAILKSTPGLTLAPVQESRREKLVELSKLHIHDCLYEQEDCSKISFSFDPTMALEAREARKEFRRRRRRSRGRSPTPRIPVMKESNGDEESNDIEESHGDEESNGDEESSGDEESNGDEEVDLEPIQQLPNEERRFIFYERHD